MTHDVYVSTQRPRLVILGKRATRSVRPEIMRLSKCAYKTPSAEITLGTSLLIYALADDDAITVWKIIKRRDGGRGQKGRPLFLKTRAGRRRKIWIPRLRAREQLFVRTIYPVHTMYEPRSPNLYHGRWIYTAAYVAGLTYIYITHIIQLFRIHSIGTLHVRNHLKFLKEHSAGVSFYLNLRKDCYLKIGFSNWDFSSFIWARFITSLEIW